jgi:DNA-binding NtrC family response regulator
LSRHDWPGNVRELENTIHRAVLLAGGDEIGPEAILSPDGQPADLRFGAGIEAGTTAGSAEAFALDDDEAGTAALVGRTVAEVERELIIDTLYHCLGNRTHAANILGISIRTLRNKLRQYGDDGVRIPLPGEARNAAL